MESVDPGSVTTGPELAALLRLARVVRLDTLSFDKMAVALNGDMSRSELCRIFAGDDFPSRAQLHLLLRLFGIPTDEHGPWDTMWERLAAARLLAATSPPAAAPSATEAPDRPLPTGPPGADLAAPPSAAPADTGVVADGTAEVLAEGQRHALRMLTDAIGEADQIVRTARADAEQDRQSVIDEAQARAAGILDRAADEQAALVRSAEQRIAGAFDAAEERLRGVMADLNDSVTGTADELRQLVRDVSSSVATIREDLTSLRQEVDLVRWSEATDNDLFTEDRVIAPPVLGQPAPGHRGGHHWGTPDDDGR